MMIQLECGNIQETGSDLWVSIREHMHCPVCNRLSKLVAIETREWKVTCQHYRCPFGPWCGQSELTAQGEKARHLRRKPDHRPIVIDYRRQPYREMKVREIVGRRVATIIANTNTTCERQVRPVVNESTTGEVPF